MKTQATLKIQSNNVVENKMEVAKQALANAQAAIETLMKDSDESEASYLADALYGVGEATCILSDIEHGLENWELTNEKE